MEKWILLALVLFIVGEAVRIYIDLKVVGRNYMTYADNNEVLAARIEQLEGHLADRDRVLDIHRKILSAKTEGFDDTALVVTTEGVKILPKGWREKLSIV